jgi:phage-related protein
MVDNPNRLDADAVVIAAVFSEKTQKTPPDIIATNRRRLKAYDDIVRQRRDP